MKKKVKLKKSIIIFMIIFLIILLPLFCFLYINVHGIRSNLNIKLKGKKEVELLVFNDYKDSGCSAKYNKVNLDKKIKINGKVNNKKVGKYTITYKVKYKHVSKSVKRVINVVDKEAPVISLTGDSINIIIGNEYTEPGYSATDNYDGDITDKVVIDNTVDNNTLGDYKITYTIADSSGNSSFVQRNVSVIAKPVYRDGEQKIAVLNYHFFFDGEERCNDGNCERVSDFRKQLDYLRDNNYKTLTMQEFRDWMYGVTELPERSVLITVDDGAMGTGFHNGNKLIPLLEEYKMHATLFLITSWWGIENYQSEYLDVESHSHDMHIERFCDGVTRGAKMLCLSDQEVLNDLAFSISITKSHLAYCFPFYAYDDRTVNLVKQAGFDLAFIGGTRKASRSNDKWHVPRYQIKQSTSLEQFIEYVS